MGSEKINERIRKAGVVWYACEGCGLEWPFPKGLSLEREWLCHRCVQAWYGRLRRLAAQKIQADADPEQT